MKEYQVFKEVTITTSRNTGEVIFIDDDHRIYFIDKTENNLYDTLTTEDVGKKIYVWVITETKNVGFVSITVGNKLVDDYVKHVILLDKDKVLGTNELEDDKLIKILHSSDNKFRVLYNNNAIMLTDYRFDLRFTVEYKNDEFLRLRLAAYQYLIDNYSHLLDLKLPIGFRDYVYDNRYKVYGYATPETYFKQIADNIVLSTPVKENIIPLLIERLGMVDTIKYLEKQDVVQ